MSENIGGETGGQQEVPTGQSQDSAEQQTPQPDANATERIENVAHSVGEQSTPYTAPTTPIETPSYQAPQSQAPQSQAPAAYSAQAPAAEQSTGVNPTQPLYRRPEQHAAYDSNASQPTTPIPAPYQASSYQVPQAQASQAQAPQAQASQPQHSVGSSAPEETASFSSPQNSENQFSGAQHSSEATGATWAQAHSSSPYGHANTAPEASESYPHTLAPAVTAEPKKRKKGMGIFVGSVAAAALIGALVGGGTAALIGNNNSANASNTTQESVPLVVNNTSSVNQISAAAAKAMPSVVTISATSGTSGGTGSGIILNTDGDILTNTHVVTLDGAAAHATIQVQLSNGKVYSGTVVGTDPLSDLAIVKISAPNLTPATLGDSSKLNVGDSVIAIGSPLGLNATVTEGIVSTLNRTIQVASSAVPSTPSDSSEDQGNGGDGGFQFSPPGGSSSTNTATGSVNLNVIQTDAAINPGNSGGALVNSTGQIIGVNVAIASTSSSSSSSSTQSGNIGVGFSIPIDHAKRIADEIIATGKATHGQLGVSVSGTSALGSNSQFTNGATVASVTAGGPAAKAGLQKGDVVTQLGDRLITDASSLTAAVRENAGGATVAMTFIRDGKTITKDVTLGTYTD